MFCDILLTVKENIVLKTALKRKRNEKVHNIWMCVKSPVQPALARLTDYDLMC